MLSLLAWAATASAECAWVLWQRNTTFAEKGPATTVSDYGLLGAFETFEKCNLGAKAIADVGAQAFKAIPGKETRLIQLPFGGWRYTVEDATTKSPAIHMDYTCVPDTVDPRGPKGK
jgi:hypothetical protein